MKIFDVERGAGEELGARLPLVMVADSAVTRAGVPLFVPPFAEEDAPGRWRVELVPVFEVGRLGKGIAARFAPRYFSAMALGARLAPPRGCRDDAQSACFDGALCLGASMPFSTDPWEVRACQGEQTSLSCLCSFESFALFELLERLSRYCTVKTGDRVIPCRLGLSFAPKLDTRISATLNGQPALSLKIK